MVNNNNQVKIYYKSVDANKAGSFNRPNRLPCVLFITDSETKSILDNMIQMECGRDQFGVMTMGNTNWNDIKDDLLLIYKNDDITELKMMLGLVDCLPNERATYYTNQENFKKLRYDSIMLATENQIIIDLVMGYFNKYFPSLLTRNFVTRG
jgi:DNA gyrase/topoisomerase IV subunit B